MQTAQTKNIVVQFLAMCSLSMEERSPGAPESRSLSHYHAHTKHINIQYHFIQDVIKKGSISLIYCSTEDMTADTLTKPLPKWKTALHNLSLRLHHVCGGVAELVPPETEEGCHSNVEHPKAQGLAYASSA